MFRRPLLRITLRERKHTAHEPCHSLTQDAIEALNVARLSCTLLAARCCPSGRTSAYPDQNKSPCTAGRACRNAGHAPTEDGRWLRYGHQWHRIRSDGRDSTGPATPSICSCGTPRTAKVHRVPARLQSAPVPASGSRAVRLAFLMIIF